MMSRCKADVPKKLTVTEFVHCRKKVQRVNVSGYNCGKLVGHKNFTALYGGAVGRGYAFVAKNSALEIQGYVFCFTADKQSVFVSVKRSVGKGQAQTVVFHYKFTDIGIRVRVIGDNIDF